MQRTPQQRFSNGTNHKRDAAFYVMVAYDDFAGCREALETCKLLVGSLGSEVEFRSTMWSFEAMQGSKLLPLATADAVDADLIIVASARSPALPEQVVQWVEAWVPQKRGQVAALVALHEPPVSSVTGLPIHLFLKTAADTAGIDFLARPIRSVTPPAAPPPPHETGIGRSPEGWGLND